MDKDKEFTIFCQFSAVGKKVIMAESFDEAKQIAESDDSVEFDEIVRITKLCKVDEALSWEFYSRTEDNEKEKIDYKNWGSE